MKKVDYEKYIGMKYGKLTILDTVWDGKRRRAKCICDCGRETEPDWWSVLSGKTKSCGCGVGESTIQRFTTHGMRHTRIYGIWCRMKARCYRKTSSDYQYYGGKGIRICDEWLKNFEAFYEWAMANGYSDELTIERKDLNGNYCPENCTWETVKQQARNRTTSIVIEYKGEKKTLAEWAEIKGIGWNTLKSRIDRGWSIEDALTIPVEKGQKIKAGKRKLYLSMNGERHSTKEWSEITGLSTKVIVYRHNAGWSDEKVLTTPFFENMSHKK